MTRKPVSAGKSSFDLIDFTVFVNALDLSGPIVLLDMACGAGSYAIEIARQLRESGRVVALDLWEAGIDKLRLRAGSLGLDNIEAAVCDVSRKMPLDDGSVDICLMATVLHDLVEDGTDRETLEEMVRVLKPAGRLAVVEFKKMPGPPGPPEKVRLSAEELNGLLEPFGFVSRNTVALGTATYLSIFQRGQGQQPHLRP
ncbi:SAM-dependent methyltransferase [Desulfosarcina alkanivorans]|uniref:SAM-dependent methyltransferase n=1 Tax=Desulfosarcina alkanivorans TaxID=571177 RepID=A0A5K7YR18_9BACT|nr:class I SAM-dependent methyltransferase [Desulfosarcina alkanivorans]BBO70765.1 SAM-dependent methyltransferase [Desulfosarcina alkanivorans]